MLLSPSQKQAAEDLQNIAVGNPGRCFPATLVYGGRGTGKRTILRAVAECLAVDFVEIPMAAGTVTSVRDRLVGSLGEAEALGSDGTRGPGELGRVDPVLVYFSNTGSIHPDLHQMFHSIITNRQYLDAAGHRWFMSDDLWIVGGLQYDYSVAIREPGISDPICSSFEVRYGIDLPEDAVDVFHIACSIVDGSAVTPKPKLDKKLALVLDALVRSAGNLHTFRDWIEAATRKARTCGNITEDHIGSALTDDVEHLLQSVRYCGSTPSQSRIRRWMRSFQPALQSVAYHLVRRLAQKYFVSDSAYFMAIRNLIEESGIPRGDRVVFCNWQSQGKSGPAVAAKMKTRANWIVRDDIDLDDDQSWGRYDSTASHRFIITDDCVGSGKTLSSLFVDEVAAIPRLLDRFPQSRLDILLVLGYEHALREVNGLIHKTCDDSRVRLITSILLSNQDRCFHDESHILQKTQTRSAMRQFCIETARDVIGLSAPFHLGFGEVGGLVVFYETVPNNTIPLLWAAGGDWEPLFPVEGVVNLDM